MHIVCVLYPDPETGFPVKKQRESIPTINFYPDGSRAPSLENIDFIPGDLLGCVSGELGLRQYAQKNGHSITFTSDKEGEDSVFEKELPMADVVISQPFWPAYLDAKRLEKAKKLRLVITAGIGSDHVDLKIAASKGITVSEVTYSNSISVAEHTVLLALSLVRNYIPSHDYARKGGWNIADCVSASYDIEGMRCGLFGAGRIGTAVIKRLAGFDVQLSYTDTRRLPHDLEEKYNLTYVPTVQDLVRSSDLITIQAPLHAQTHHLFNDDLFALCHKGTYLINNARGAICDPNAVVRALDSGVLAGYAGDVWYPQPAPATHPWRTMPRNGMTPHISGTSLSAQTRYAAGTLEILQAFAEGHPIRDEYLIVDQGQLAGTGARSYTIG